MLTGDEINYTIDKLGASWSTDRRMDGFETSR